MPDLLPRLTDGFEAAAREGGAWARIRAADRLSRELTGQELCTAMFFDRQAMTVRRVFSSRPADYPVGGSKPKRDTEWGRRVLLRGECFTGEGEAAIRAHFADHAVIAGLGLRSIVNVPVLAGGACLGTLNLLWPGSRLEPAQIAVARLLALLAAPDWTTQDWAAPDWTTPDRAGPR